MSRRQQNCDHSHWLIRPGNVIECKLCGETIDQEELADFVGSGNNLTDQGVHGDRGAVFITNPLTHHIKIPN